MNLAITQLISLTTKAITTALGIVQALLVVHFLTRAEFGLAGLVTSIGSVIGVTQHLGVVDGAIREIAVQKDDREVGKLFWVSLLMRQLVTLPLSLVLIAAAHVLSARVYNLPEIAPLVQLYAVSLILLGIQDVLGATLTGMKKFISLYVVQIGTAALNIIVFAFATARFATTGYFWAIIVTTTLMVVWYAVIIGRTLRGNLRIPAWQEFMRLTRRVFRVSLYMYLSRILFVVWQRLPLLVLGIVIAKEQLGDLNLSLTFGSKLTILAMALAEVNLSWMSSLFVRNQAEFQAVVTRNMQRLFFVLVLCTIVLIFFAPEILYLPVLREYLPAQNMVMIMTVAFFVYSLIDIGTSSVFVAADQPRWRAACYALMTALTAVVVGWLLITRPDPLWATVGVLAGASVAYAAVVLIAWRRFRVALLTPSLTLVLALILAALVWLMSAPPLGWRVLVFVLLSIYLLLEIRRSKLLPSIKQLIASNKQGSAHTLRFICFAGAFYDAPTWTNRQHVMSRIATQHPVLYVEPRVWLVRYIVEHWKQPRTIFRFLKRIVWWEEVSPQLCIKSQWNLIPGSREYGWVGRLNHGLNRWNVLLTAKLLGFQNAVVWIYDTEAAEYLSAFRGAKVVYDCVDDHAVQAGPNRNSKRVHAEEAEILRRANLVTVTSERLFEQKKTAHTNTHLVEQGGDVQAFLTKLEAPARGLPSRRPLIGSVGALDSYKYDFDLLENVAKAHPEWEFVFIGEPVVERRSAALARLETLPNVTLLGAVDRHHVPAYVHQFDVCVIPYKASDYNRASVPLKFWEFMATGKPIVVSGLPELKRYTPSIHYAPTAERFAEKIQQALTRGAEGIEQRLSLAREHTWEKRVTHLLQLVNTL